MFVEPELHDSVEQIVRSIFASENLPFLPSARNTIDLVSSFSDKENSHRQADFCIDLVLHNIFGRPMNIGGEEISKYREARASYWDSRREVSEPVLREFRAFEPDVLITMINESDAIQSMGEFQQTKDNDPSRFQYHASFLTRDHPSLEVNILIYGRATASSVVAGSVNVSKGGEDLADLEIPALLDIPFWLPNKKNFLATERELKTVADEISYLISLVKKVFLPDT